MTVAAGDTEKTEPDSSEGFHIAKEKSEGLQVAAWNYSATKGIKITVRVGKHCYISPERWWNIYP